MKARSKIILSVSALVAALAVSTTATFAWFTTSQNPTIEGWDMNVQARTASMTIAVAKDLTAAKALGPEAYVAKVTKTTITDALKVSGSIPTLGAVTLTTKESGKFQNKAGTEMTANQKDSYLSFVLAFKSDNALDVNFLPNDAASVMTGKTGKSKAVKAWKNITKDEYGTHEAISKGADIAADVANAARVSFVPVVTNQDAWGTMAKVWDPNSDKGYNKANTNLALDYYNYINGTSESATAPVAGETSWTAAVLANTAFAKKTTGTDTESYYSYLQVNIWLEGWDGDCFDTILDQVLTIGLAFEGKTPSVPAT